MTNPYRHLLDPQNDAAEHASELADGMAIAYRSPVPQRGPEMWDRFKALDAHRAARRALQAELAAEALRGAA